jgi:hypothetical protein
MPDIQDSNDDSQQPLGRKIRELMNAALRDDRRSRIQLDLLDKAFGDVAAALPRLLDKEFTQFERHVRSNSKDAPERAAPIVITAVTATEPGQTEESKILYSPARRFKLPVSNSFADFIAQEIRELPNYKKLHEVARELDVALSLGGLVEGDETHGKGIAYVGIDAMKSYDQGADFLYPELPPRKVPFDKKSSRGFDLG